MKRTWKKACSSYKKDYKAVDCVTNINAIINLPKIWNMYYVAYSQFYGIITEKYEAHCASPCTFTTVTCTTNKDSHISFHTIINLINKSKLVKA